MTNNQFFILVLGIIIVFLFLYKKKNFLTSLDYSSIDDPYEEPYIINNIITEKEAKYIIKKATPKFKDSLIIDDSIEGKLDKTIRKSKTVWMNKDDPLIYNIMTRIANMVNLPIENTELLQVVKYEPNGYYKHHYDSCCDNTKYCIDFIKNGGQRKKTVLIYLNDDFIEGETDFPVINKKIKPHKYCAVVFNSLAKYNNKCHPKSLHAGLPVKSGIKYVANLWFREDKYVL